MNASATTVKTTDSDRLRAFQIQAAAARQAAGFRPKVPKGNVAASSIGALYEFDELNSLYLDELTPERIAFWRQLDARQECWRQAVDAFESYRATDTLDYLRTCQALAAATGSERALDKAEERFSESKLTNGPFPLRKQFWVFVGYKLRGYTPNDLVFLISGVHSQIDAEAAREHHAKCVAEYDAQSGA